MTSNVARPDHDELVTALRRIGLIGQNAVQVAPLTGGVSSLIVRVDDGGRVFCAKSALPQLKVEADWRVPVRRNRAEVAWMRQAARIAPGAVPAILGADADANVFAMEWLDPAQHPVWKDVLLRGDGDAAFAAAAGSVLGRLHQATADQDEIAAAFANEADFDALRLDPYLRATAARHRDLSGRLLAILKSTAETRRVLIHGDVSPKNILIGPKGPIFLDAECATYGDPAFDLAFCLNHLALKWMHMPARGSVLIDSFTALSEAYLEHVTWEPRAALETRAASLLAALALARVDGKSPVEYLSEQTRDRVRRAGRRLVGAPAATLGEFLATWRELSA